MIRLSAGIALVLLSATTSSGEPSDKPQARPYAVWVVGQGEKNGRQIKVRWRDKMPGAETRAAFAWRLEVTWRFQRNESGKVSGEETERAWDLETTLDEEIEKPGDGMQVASFTDDEKRVWLYYVADRDEAAASVDTIKRDDAELPISYEIHADREWQALQELLGAVKE